MKAFNTPDLCAGERTLCVHTGHIGLRYRMRGQGQSSNHVAPLTSHYTVQRTLRYCAAAVDSTVVYNSNILSKIKWAAISVVY